MSQEQSLPTQRNHRKSPRGGENGNNEEGVEEHDQNMNDSSGKKKTRRPCAFYRRGKCRSGENCKFLHIGPQDNETNEEGEQPSEVENQEAEGGEVAETSTKRNKSRKVCVFFRRDNCKFGDNCKYLHPSGENKVASGPTEQEEEVEVGAVTEAGLDPTKFRTKPCRFFRRGHCNSGDECPFLHVSRGNSSSNNNNSNNPRKSTEPFFQTDVQKRVEEEEQAEQQQGKEEDEALEPDQSKYRTKPCRYFRRGKCNSGDDCKFLHSERAPKQQHAESSPSTAHIKQDPLQDQTLAEAPDSRIRTKPCTYFRRGHCRAGEDCLFLHAVSDAPLADAAADANAASASRGNKNKKNKYDSGKAIANTFPIYSMSSDKKKSREIQFPVEDGRVSADHFEDLDPFVVLVSYEVRVADFPNHAAIKRGLHDIFMENLGFYETNSPSVLEADVASLCSLLDMKPSEDVHRVVPALRARLNALIDAGLKPNNGLFGDYNAAAAWLNTIYNNECDSMPTSPKEEAAPLVMYFARRPAVFA